MHTLRWTLVLVFAVLTALPALAYEGPWGRTLQFGIFPHSLAGEPQWPKGLIRLWYPTRPGHVRLINFLAVEPVVHGKHGFSELERLDFKARPQPGPDVRIRIDIQRFRNGAHVYLILHQSAAHPEEVAVTVHRLPDSAPLEQCIITATWGNFSRSRLLWLADRVINSHTVYGTYRGTNFSGDKLYSDLRRLPKGQVTAAITTDEAHPNSVHPVPGTLKWYWDGDPITQYWRTRAAHTQVRVNGRFVYWKSKTEVPGGITFENFELRAPYREGQTWIYGASHQTPAAMGWSGVSR